jgi:hypothetical protein
MSTPHESAVPSRTAGGELVGHRLVDEDPLRGDAQLPGGREAPPHGPRDGTVEVGVVRDVHAVLAAQLEADPHEAFGRRPGHDPTGLGRSREADVVGPVDDGLTGPTVAEHDLDDVLREPGAHEEVDDRQRREGRLEVGPHDDGVPREQSRDGVGDRQREETMPTTPFGCRSSTDRLSIG